MCVYNCPDSRATDGAVVTLTPHKTATVISVQGRSTDYNSHHYILKFLSDAYLSLESGHGADSSALFQHTCDEQESVPETVSQALVTGRSMQVADYRSRSGNYDIDFIKNR